MSAPSHRIFLSHSSKDHAFCIRLVDDLRRILGNDDAVWYDARGGLHGGDAWWRKIVQELGTRDIFMLILSPDTMTSEWVNDEIGIAWKRKNSPAKMRILPVLYRPCDIRDDIDTLQIVSFVPPKTYEAALQEILIALGVPSQPASAQRALQNHIAASAPGQNSAAPPRHLLTARPEAIEALLTLNDHESVILSVALSTDGQALVSGSADQTIKLWNVATGQLSRTLTGHTGQVYSIALSTDKRMMASGSDDRTIKLWNVQTGQLLRTLTGHTDTIWSVALSADGQVLASGSFDGKIKLWNVQAGQLLRTIKRTGRGHTSFIRSVAWSLEDHILASGSYDGTIKLWNAQTGQLLRTLTGHTGDIWSIAGSVDRNMLASGSYDGTIKLWNVQTGQLLHTLTGHAGAVECIALSSDGQVLASGGRDQTIKIWGVKE